MITKILTSNLLNDYNSSVDFPGAITDTFIAGSDIYFVCPRSTFNSISSESITSGNINTYSLYYELYESLEDYNNDEVPVISDVISLTNSNLANDSILINLTELKQVNNDFLYENITENEIFNLLKTYTIVFNINSGSRDSAKDVVHSINFVFDSSEPGPYSVNFSEIEYLHPDDFTAQERIEYSSYNPYTQGEEKVRAFYPNELNSNCPLFVFQHGNGQETESYDFYLSAMASYGYFCISLYNDSDDITANGISNIKLIHFIKTNKTKIRSKIFEKVDFSKIIFAGHSRGGGAAISSYLRLKNKNNPNSVITSTSISLSDIKCLVCFADFSLENIDNQNVLVSGVKYAEPTYVQNLQETDKSLFDVKVHLPIIYFFPCEDNDVSQQNSIHPTYRGFSYDIKRNFEEVEIITTPYGSHNAFSEFYVFNADESLISSYPKLFQRLEDKITYNTLKPIQNTYLSELIYFCGSNVFSSTKIKKLKYYQKYQNKLKIVTDKSNYSDRVSYIKYADIKYNIDSYSGITSSLAGITGFTFSAIGYTYDFCLDDSIYNRVGLAGSTAISLNKENLVNPLLVNPRGLYNFSGYTLTDSDTYNGIFHCNYKGLFLPIENNFVMGYTFSTGLSLAENDYLCLRGCLKYFYPITGGNTFDANFKIEVKDSQSNTASLSSKISGGGFKKPYKVSEIIISGYERLKVPTLTTNVYFRAGDFYLKNPSIGLTNISEITLSFGPNHGSTFAHLVLDEFIVIKEL